MKDGLSTAQIAVAPVLRRPNLDRNDGIAETVSAIAAARRLRACRRGENEWRRDVGSSSSV
jgi:hypothetical protein